MDYKEKIIGMLELCEEFTEKTLKESRNNYYKNYRDIILNSLLLIDELMDSLEKEIFDNIKLRMRNIRLKFVDENFKRKL